MRLPPTITKKFVRLCAVASIAVSATSWATDIAIGATQGLVFGKFVAGGGGSVTVSPANSRTRTGTVWLVQSGPGSAAQFDVTGNPNAAYSITLPNNDSVFLTSGQNSMAVNSFTSNPASTGLLSGSGLQTLMVGATLSVGNNQASGSYSTSFPVIVNYP